MQPGYLSSAAAMSSASGTEGAIAPRLQHLLQLEIVYQHGIWVDPVGLRQRSTAWWEDTFARHQGLQRRMDSRGRCRYLIRAKQRLPSGIS